MLVIKEQIISLIEYFAWNGVEEEWISRYLSKMNEINAIFQVKKEKFIISTPDAFKTHGFLLFYDLCFFLSHQFPDHCFSFVGSILLFLEKKKKYFLEEFNSSFWEYQASFIKLFSMLLSKFTQFYKSRPELPVATMLNDAFAVFDVLEEKLMNFILRFGSVSRLLAYLPLFYDLFEIYVESFSWEVYKPPVDGQQAINGGESARECMVAYVDEFNWDGFKWIINYQSTSFELISLLYESLSYRPPMSLNDFANALEYITKCFSAFSLFVCFFSCFLSMKFNVFAHPKAIEGRGHRKRID